MTGNQPYLIGGAIFLILVLFAIFFPRWWRSRGALTEKEAEEQVQAGEVPGGFSFFDLANLRLALMGLLVGLAAVAVIAVLAFGIAAIITPASAQVPNYIARGSDFIDQRESTQATQAAQLESYGWQNQQANAAHIPVERAMTIIEQRGLPAVETAIPTGVVVTPPAGQAQQPPGEALFTQLGCIGCHQSQDTQTAPTLVGVFGSQVKLQSGETVTADEAYIRQSILQPESQVVAGYQPIMPSFQGRVSEDQLTQLVDYIKSLAQGQ
jgi:mono/diheme cytochrome c family protein